jgi:hypothetical protein
MRAINAWREGRVARATIEVVPGTIEQLDALLPLHYRGGRPATIERVLAAIDTEHDQLAGVLATSRPVLNGSWREAAFGERFCSGDRSADARAINAEPAHDQPGESWTRGTAVLGVGTGLVRAYLASPATACTESITALGPTCPIFASAGMRECAIPRPPRHDRLVRALGAATDLDAARRLLETAHTGRRAGAAAVGPRERLDARESRRRRGMPREPGGRRAARAGEGVRPRMTDGSCPRRSAAAARAERARHGTQLTWSDRPMTGLCTPGCASIST